MTAAEKSAEMDRQIARLSQEDRDRVNAIAAKIVDAIAIDGTDSTRAYIALSSVYWFVTAELDKPVKN